MPACNRQTEFCACVRCFFNPLFDARFSTYTITSLLDTLFLFLKTDRGASGLLNRRWQFDDITLWERVRERRYFLFCLVCRSKSISRYRSTVGNTSRLSYLDAGTCPTGLYCCNTISHQETTSAYAGIIWTELECYFSTSFVSILVRSHSVQTIYFNRFAFWFMQVWNAQKKCTYWPWLCSNWIFFSKRKKRKANLDGTWQYRSKCLINWNLF